jgi:acetyl-CoA C-acetyltransferase
VKVGSWEYDDLPTMIASRLGARPRHTLQSDVGGNRPAELVDQAAARIAAGVSEVAVVVGAEAQASLAALHRAGIEPAWTRAPGGPVQYDDSVRGSRRMWAHGLMAPVRVYPLYENALRAALGHSHDEAQEWSAEICAAFTEVAACHPAAWNQQVRTAAEIASTSPSNRMICFPYPLLMNSFPGVDQAAAVIVASSGHARGLGLPEDRWVHVWGGAGASDSSDVLDRVSFERSPGMTASFDAAFVKAGIGPESVDVLDLYACFPVVPKLASLHLGLPRGRRLTTTGGNTAFGGPGNNFSLHAIASVSDELRRGHDIGLVYANGEYVTKHHVLLLASRPHADGYIGHDGLVTPREVDGPPVVDVAEGPATIETFTVEYDRAGLPSEAFIIGRLPGGARFAANAAPGDTATLARLVDPSIERVGLAVVARHDDGRNLVGFP